MEGKLDMTNDQLKNLKALAEAAGPSDAWPSALELDVEFGFYWDAAAFISAADPEAVLELIGQRDDLLAALKAIARVDYQRGLATADPTTYVATPENRVEYIEDTDAVDEMADIARAVIARAEANHERHVQLGFLGD